MDYSKNYNYQNPYTTSKETQPFQEIEPQAQPPQIQPQLQAAPPAQTPTEQRQATYVQPTQQQYCPPNQQTYPQQTPTNQGVLYQQQGYGYPPIVGPSANGFDIYESSYIENILRLNKGKVGTFYFTYTDSSEWRDRVYKGVIEAAGRDHLIISDPKTGKRYLFQLIYFDWAEFDEEIAYEYPIR